MALLYSRFGKICCYIELFPFETFLGILSNECVLYIYQLFVCLGIVFCLHNFELKTRVFKSQYLPNDFFWPLTFVELFKLLPFGVKIFIFIEALFEDLCSITDR